MVRDFPLRRVLFSVLIVTLSTQAVFILGAAFFDLGPEFGLGADGLGLLTASFFVTAGVTSTPLGRWVQRVGWRRAARLNALGSGVLLLATPVLATSPFRLAALLVAAAAVYGMANPAANAALAEVSTVGRRATMFGIKHAGIPTSTLVAGVLVPVVVLAHGWRWAYVAGSLLAPAVWWLTRDGAAPSAVHTGRRTGSRALSKSLLVWLGVGSALASWAATSLGTFLVSASIAKGFAADSAGLLLTAGSLVTISARLVLGMATDRRAGDAWTAMALLMSVGSVVFAALAGPGGPVFAGLVLVAFATGWGWPGLMTYAVVDANPSSVAASSAITQAGVLIGAGVGPIVLGQVVEFRSFDAMWVVVSVALILGSGLVHLVARAAAVDSISQEPPPAPG